ncbi:MAG: CoA transferase [Ilumatobacteraceae bacterium]
MIKVESAVGDETRTWRPPEHDGTATYYLSINRNKRSVVVDFRDPDDVALVRELFRAADIVLELHAGQARRVRARLRDGAVDQPSSCTCRSVVSARATALRCPGTTSWSRRCRG